MTDQKSVLYKIFDLKAKDFYWIFGVEGEDRLTPFKTETPKSLENNSFQAGSDNSFHPKRNVKTYIFFGTVIVRLESISA